LQAASPFASKRNSAYASTAVSPARQDAKTESGSNTRISAAKTMRVFRLRITVRKIMVAIATIAVAWSMCLGIGHLTNHRTSMQVEVAYREAARLWDAKQDTAKAAERRRQAEELANQNAESLAYILMTFSLIGLVVVLGATAGIGLLAQALYRKRNRVAPRWVDIVARTCSAVGVIVMVGFALGCIAYFGITMFVAVTRE
jgi:hypothetical protein